MIEEKYMKRKILYLVLSLVILVGLFIPNISFANTISSNSVNEQEAIQAAVNHIKTESKSMPGWNGAGISKPVIYYAPDDTKSAYEFTVVNNDKSVGFVIVSARKDWTPILEYSDGSAPSSFLPNATQYARENNYLSENDNSIPNIYYWGACTYSMQIGSKMESERPLIHLTTGQINKLPTETPILQMDKKESNDAWAKISESISVNPIIASLKSLFTPSPAMASVKKESSPLTKTSFTENYVSQVPPFYQGFLWIMHGDDHDNNAEAWPMCAGTADDLWVDFDGCAPIAGAMVLGYWHHMGYTNIPDPDTDGTEDTLIDNCHHCMGTNDATGGTSTDLITSGMQSVLSGLYSYTFSGSYTYTTWDLVVSNITNYRPFVMDVGNSPGYGANHSVCVYGYKDEDTDSLRIFNTWDASTSHYITWGNWSYSYMHELHP
jgi:hypothetical protein